MQRTNDKVYKSVISLHRDHIFQCLQQTPYILSGNRNKQRFYIAASTKKNIILLMFISRERDSKRSDLQPTKDIHIRLWKYCMRKYLYNRLILALCSNCRQIYMVVMSKCKGGVDIIFCVLFKYSIIATYTFMTMQF